MKLLNKLRKLFKKQQIPTNKIQLDPKVEWASLWKIPNKMWDNGFAANKPGEDLHPGVIMELNEDKISCNIIPGTSKPQKMYLECVYDINLKSSWKKSYFLIIYSMTISCDNVLKFRQGWGDVKALDQQQKDGLCNKAKSCIGKNHDIRPR